MRAFLSYDISEPPFIERVRSLQSDLTKTGADLKLVNPSILHFTIHFLGEIDEIDKRQIIDSLNGHVNGFEAKISFRGMGAFPDVRRFSVVWLGIDQASTRLLEEQSRIVSELLKPIGTLRKENEERFSPHVTIARVRSGRNKEKLAEFIKAHRSNDFGSSEIKNLRLKLSMLTPAGPEYSDLHVFE